MIKFAYFSILKTIIHMWKEFCCVYFSLFSGKLINIFNFIEYLVFIIT